MEMEKPIHKPKIKTHKPTQQNKQKNPNWKKRIINKVLAQPSETLHSGEADRKQTESKKCWLPALLISFYTCWGSSRSPEAFLVWKHVYNKFFFCLAGVESYFMQPKSSKIQKRSSWLNYNSFEGQEYIATQYNWGALREGYRLCHSWVSLRLEVD